MDFKDFQKLLNGGGVKINGGVGTKYKRKEMKIRLSLLTLLTLLNIGISSTYCRAAYSNKTSRVHDTFMNFFVIPHEI